VRSSSDAISTLLAHLVSRAGRHTWPQVQYRAKPAPLDEVEPLRRGGDRWVSPNDHRAGGAGIRSQLPSASRRGSTLSSPLTPFGGEQVLQVVRLGTERQQVPRLRDLSFGVVDDQVELLADCRPPIWCRC
jgi:hypothetical protein